MKNLYYFSISLLFFSAISACDIKVKECSDKYINSTLKDIHCNACKTYAFTYKVDSGSVKDYILWEDILRPKHFTSDDLSAFSMTYYPSICVPALKCLSCYHEIAYPQKMRSGDITRIAFYLSAVKSRRSKSS